MNSPIASFSLVALDCPNPQELALFYAAICGGTIKDQDEDDWVVLQSEVGASIAFQQVNDYHAPIWPGQERPQQAHLDFDVVDLDVAEAAIMAIGARSAGPSNDPHFRVYLDPAGHPFCLVLVR